MDSGESIDSSAPAIPHPPPEALRSRKQWLCWRLEQHPEEKKPRKVPYYVNGKRRYGDQGSESDRAALTDFDTAKAAVDQRKLSGVGFAFLPGDGLIGIDLDKVIDTDTGEVSDRARNIIAACASYTEFSPSGTGVHIFVQGVSETFKSNAIGVEVFCGRQYFTWTGRHYPDTPATVEPIDADTLRRLRVTVDNAKGRRDKPAFSGPPPLLDKRAKVESALAFVSADIGYNDWIAVGMAIYQELGGAGFSVWNYWSTKSAKYPGERVLEQHWKSFTGDYNEAPLYAFAKAGGWKPPRRARTDAAPPGQQAPAGEPNDEAAAPGAPPPPGKKNKKVPPATWDRVLEALDEWVLIRGTDTVWDAPRGKIIKVANLRLAEGKEVVNPWLANADRKTVEDDNVVFDPTCKTPADTHVNLFRGMAMKPDGSGSCAQLLELLFYLCQEDEKVFDWVLKWCAYPLQHPGAKMASAVVMYGPEGAGKNIWWGALRKIYDPYSALITQRELESAFNGWASRKLFVIGNEVVSRQERMHHIGYLKNLITEEVIQINEKMLPLRAEANHMQIVFLSNELQPLQISPDDRRYMIIKTPDPQPRDYYAKAVAELHAGGVEALYARLLEMDLGDFTAHTPPIVTEAKRSLVELGKTSPQLFFHELSQGMLPLSFGPCMSLDLYGAFQTWCHRNGDKNPPKLNRFSNEIESFPGVRRGKPRFTDPDDPGGARMIQRTVFFFGEPGEGEAEETWLGRSIRAFHEDEADYRRVRQ